MKRVAQKKLRRVVLALVVMGLAWLVAYNVPEFQQPVTTQPEVTTEVIDSPALETLAGIETKGRAPKTGYSRNQFGDGWESYRGCDVRNTILYRDLTGTVVNDECKVMSGTLSDPYTGTSISFVRGTTTSDDVQIDHVVALSDAWQKGAQQLSYERRVQLANDPLNLLAVDGPANQQKSDGDAATWLPANTPFRCQYVARQIAVKAKYALWVTTAERDAMTRVLQRCPDQSLPAE